MNGSIYLCLFLFTAMLVFPIQALSQDSITDDTGITHQSIPEIAQDLVPDDADRGPVATVNEAKFDPGFYSKIQQLLLEGPIEDDIRVHNGQRYYDVIIVVPRDNGDDRDPDEVAKENKGAIVKRLLDIGARNVFAAESLSFVTASIPVKDIIDFSTHNEVYAIGDGELPIIPDVDTARRTIHATQSELRTLSGTVLDGTGVTVAVIDKGINHPSLNDKVIDRVRCNPDGCRPNIIADVNNKHGIRVAQVLAASGLPEHNGIASGVKLLDVKWVNRFGGFLVHAIDWSFTNGADIASMSFSDYTYPCGSRSTTQELIVNEVVDKGMVAVKSAGNSRAYLSIGNPGCSNNVITVGGINDRDSSNIMMFEKSSRGPSTITQPILKPDVVAPAYRLNLLDSFTSNIFTNSVSGTSFATPQVSATAALLLQARPDLTPVEIKAAILLGADWKGPTTLCTSKIYEVRDSSNNCSYAKQPDVKDSEAHDTASLQILNNVGFGILDVAKTIDYVHEVPTGQNYVIGDYVDSTTSTKTYTIRITDTTTPVKVILSWFIHPHGDILEQDGRNTTVSPADLNLSMTCPGQTIDASSNYQTNEFIVFTPTQTGTCTITVSGLDPANINKPIQNYALASTNSLTINPITPINTNPGAISKTAIINPNSNEPVEIRLHARDSNQDPITFGISANPRFGIVTTAELITKTTSRVLYTPNSDFNGRDAFEVTPQDGLIAGIPARITIRAESLPSGSTEASIDSTNVDWWFRPVSHISSLDKTYSYTTTGPTFPISSVYVSSANMEGAVLTLSTTQATYKIAIPSSGDRMIDFATPITVRSVTLSVDGVDEEAAFDLIQSEPTNSLRSARDIHLSVGFVPTPCSASCTPEITFTESSQTRLSIPDNTRTQSVSDTININANGEISSVFVTVDISHPYIGDLTVNLVSPSGTVIPLHNHLGGSTDNIMKTYSADGTNLGSLTGSNIAGNWRLTVGDYAYSDTGTLNSWSLRIVYTPTTSTPTTPSEPTTIFNDDFETSLSKWTETGDGDWRRSTSYSQSVPILTGHQRTNMVLHADNCDNRCTMTLRTPLDLSDYSSATLSFWRFVDYAIDRHEYLKVDLFTGRSWTTIFSWTNNDGDDNRWHQESYDLSQHLQSNIKIRFVTSVSQTSEDVQIDDVVITGTRQSGSSPTPPTTPTPPPTPPTSQESIYVSDSDDQEIRVFSMSGSDLGDIVPRRNAGIDRPWGIAFGPDNNLYIADFDDNNIRKYSRSGSSLGSSSSNSEWVTTGILPRGLTWHNNVLYVATLRGIEHFSSSGTNLGLFGDAIAGRSTNNLRTPYDVAFCPNGRMYVADYSLGDVLYYSSTGRYLGSLGDDDNSLDTNEASGVMCGPSIRGTGTSIYQSGEDPGMINEINPTTHQLIHSFTSLIDEPTGLDMDRNGNLYTVNKDDDNLVRITSSGTASVMASNGFDDPRDVYIGPGYSSTTSSSDSTSSSSDISEPSSQNEEPKFELYNNNTIIPYMINVSSPISLEVRAIDPEGDHITIKILHNDLPQNTLSIIDHNNGTATLSIDASGVEADQYLIVLEAFDTEENYEYVPYSVLVSP